MPEITNKSQNIKSYLYLCLKYLTLMPKLYDKISFRKIGMTQWNSEDKIQIKTLSFSSAKVLRNCFNFILLYICNETPDVECSENRNKCREFIGADVHKPWAGGYGSASLTGG